MNETRLGIAVLMVFSSGTLSVAWKDLDAACLQKISFSRVRADYSELVNQQQDLTSFKAFADATDWSDSPCLLLCVWTLLLTSPSI